MDKEIKIVLPEKQYKGAPPTDLNEKVYLDIDKRDVTENDRNIRIDLIQQFNEERQACDKFRIYGKITPLFLNSYSGFTDYQPLLNSLYLTQSPFIDGSNNYGGYPPYNEFAFIRNDLTRETADKNGILKEIIGNKHLEVYPHNSYQYNWNMYMSYVYDKDETRPITYTISDGTSIKFVAGDGIPVIITFDLPRRIAYCQSPVEHGLSESDYVLINGTLLKIDSLGDETYESEKKVFNIQLIEVTGTTVSQGLNTFKRVTDKNNLAESTSKYYVHKHKVISKVSDYILDRCGFESSIFENNVKLDFENPDGTKEVYKEKERGEAVLFHFKEPLNRVIYNNNFNLPITDIYLSVLQKNQMGFFNYPPKVGWSFNFHNTHGDYHFSGSTSQENIPYKYLPKENYSFAQGEELTTGSTMIGAFVEYNKYDLKERIISEALHKFSFNKDIFDHGQDLSSNYPFSSPDNPYGYFYQPHNRIKLKDYSSYIEESTTSNIENFPRNAIYFIKDKVWRWRDLYDHGFIDESGNGVDYPFINGTHYIKFDIRFYIRSEYHFNKKDKIITPFTNRKYRNEC